MHIAKLALLVVAGATASGGIALASAETGSQPSDPGRVLPTNAASQAQVHAGPVLAQHPSGQPSEPDETDETEAPESPEPSDAPDSESQGTPTPSLVGLCHAWLAGAGAEHGKARSNPAFTVLITAAGGSDAVDAYCTTLLGASPSPSGEDSDEPAPPHPDRPSHPGPTSHPGNTLHPNKTAHPGRTSHPSGRPSDVPPVPHH